MQTKIALLRDLFVHRDDVFAEQWYRANTGEGGYLKATTKTCPGTPCPTRCEHQVAKPLTDREIKEHIQGRKTLGVYQLGEGDTVKWVCFDVDKDKTLGKHLDPATLSANAQEQVRRLAKRCHELKLPPVVEDSGNRGYHVWLLFAAPIPASIAQAVGQFVLEGTPLLDGLHIELFPKQISTRSFGNLVKLPLGLHRKSQRRAVFVNRQFAPLADQWRFLQTAPRVDPAIMAATVDWYDLKPVSIRRQIETKTDYATGFRAPLCLIKMLHEGIGDGMRDVGTFKIACYLRDRGLPESYAHTLMQDWDKHNDPPLGEERVTIKVTSAYSDAYSFLPCFDPVFDTHCTTTCDFYTMKQERRKLSTTLPQPPSPSAVAAPSVAVPSPSPSI